MQWSAAASVASPTLNLLLRLHHGRAYAGRMPCAEMDFGLGFFLSMTQDDGCGS